MYVIIVGCGSVGAGLAGVLTAEGHDVVVIDKRSEAFERLGSGFNGVTVTGTGIDEGVLRRAGIERADAFAAVTSDDNTNIMAAQIAQELFRVPRVVARVFDPEREYAYKEFGLSTVCPTDVGVAQIRSALVISRIDRLFSLGGGEIEIVQLPVKDVIDGRKVRQLAIPDKFRPIAVVREHRAFIVQDDTALVAGDTLIAAIRLDAVEGVRRAFGLVEEGGR